MSDYTNSAGTDNSNQNNNPATAFNSIMDGSMYADIMKVLSDGSVEITDPALVKEIAEKVYELLRKDARVDRERHGY